MNRSGWHRSDFIPVILVAGLLFGFMAFVGIVVCR